MARILLAVLLLCAPTAALTDDLQTSRLEQDVRALQRQVQALSRQVDELRAQLTRTSNRPGRPPPPSAPATNTGAWLDASKWQRVKPGMSELEVVSALGPPTAMRAEKNERVLLYAVEIGSSGFLGGSVRLRDRIVVEVQAPTLQ
jgi:hypothetical protein